MEGRQVRFFGEHHLLDGIGLLGWSLAERLLRFRPEDVVGRIPPRPLPLIHGDRSGWMYDDHPTFLSVTQGLTRFFGDAIGADPIMAVSA